MWVIRFSNIKKGNLPKRLRTTGVEQSYTEQNSRVSYSVFKQEFLIAVTTELHLSSIKNDAAIEESTVIQIRKHFLMIEKVFSIE